jgi:hypothetical protein
VAVTANTYRCDHSETPSAGTLVARLSRDPDVAGAERGRFEIRTTDSWLVEHLRTGRTITLSVGTNRDPQPGPSALDTLTDDWPDGGRIP